MIKTFTMKVTVDTETRQITTETLNDGFGTLELLGVIEAKKQDVLNQFYHPEDFVRIHKDANEGLGEFIYIGDVNDD